MMVETRHGIGFGPFRLYPAERLLEKEGTVVQLGSRALDLLTVLVERAGEVVSKGELLSRAWPKLTVDESSLRFQIVGLRRALEDGAPNPRYIMNIPGRGYCFVAPATVVAREQPRAGRVDDAHAFVLPEDLDCEHGRANDTRFAEAHLAGSGASSFGLQHLLSDSDLATLIEICRKLGSVALAMELATGRASKASALLAR